ncbi:MAG: hypothetical protein OEY44_02430 [Candidatus Peregrinibacteria bacterium]|nr:hypothetical protein [Candidatus Peregrinibacteria bacterium]
MKLIKHPISLGLAFTILLSIVHIILSAMVDDPLTLRPLRPFRDALFFPAFFVSGSTSEFYCWFAELGLGDYGRCVWGDHPLDIPLGPPAWLETTFYILSFVIMIAFYAILFWGLQRLLARLRRR